MSKNLHRANIGEWSELYVLATLLTNGGANAADQNQSAIEEEFHKIVEIFECDKDQSQARNYKILEDSVEIYRDKILVKRILRSDIQIKLDNFYHDLEQNRGTKTFELGSGTELLEFLEKDKPSASSASTENDLELIMVDKISGSLTPRIGFSIKSQLGSASTLLNASGATNLIFRIHQNPGISYSNLPQLQHGKHKSNLSALSESGFYLEFDSFSSDQFARNLKLLDSNMHIYLSKILLTYYSTDLSTLKDVTEYAFPQNIPENYQPIFKIKEFVGNIAMGMRPSKFWDGDTTKFKGLLISKNNGEVLFYHLYNRKSFEEYLFNNLRFDRPDTDRHKYGYIYQENEKYLIKLNLQLRFTK